MRIENKIKKINLYIKLGNYVEYLDFSLFAFLSPLILKNLSKIDDNITSAIYGYLIFASAYLMRPLGGWFFGSISDSKGRQFVLTYTVLLMSVCSLIISLLPSYKQIGYVSILLVLVFRSLQCFAIGGEFTNGLVLLYEINKKGRSSKIGLFLGMGTLGWFSGATIVLIVSKLKDLLPFEELIWRIPFFISGLLSLIVFFLRRRFIEIIDFSCIEEFKWNNENTSADKSRLLKIVSVIIFAGWNGALFYGLFLFPATFFSLRFNSPLDEFFTYSHLCMIFYMMFLIITGILFDKYYNIRIIKIVSIVICCPILIAAYFLISNGKYLVIAAAISAFATAMVMNTTAILLPGMFPKKERVKTLSWYYNIGISILGATTPFVCILLLQEYSLILPFLYIVGISLIGSIFLLKV